VRNEHGYPSDLGQRSRLEEIVREAVPSSINGTAGRWFATRAVKMAVRECAHACWKGFEEGADLTALGHWREIVALFPTAFEGGDA
jgi:hypothetical protein